VADAVVDGLDALEQNNALASQHIACTQQRSQIIVPGLGKGTVIAITRLPCGTVAACQIWS
jgi:hypothetical protein